MKAKIKIYGHQKNQKDDKKTAEEEQMEQRLKQKHDAFTTKLVTDKKKRAPVKTGFEKKVLNTTREL